MSTLIKQMRPARAGVVALTLIIAGQCQLPMSAQQAPAAPLPDHLLNDLRIKATIEESDDESGFEDTNQLKFD